MIDMKSLEQMERNAVHQGAVTPEQFLLRILQQVARRKQRERRQTVRSRTGFLKAQAV